MTEFDWAPAPCTWSNGGCNIFTSLCPPPPPHPPPSNLLDLLDKGLSVCWPKRPTCCWQWSHCLRPVLIFPFRGNRISIKKEVQEWQGGERGGVRRLKGWERAGKPAPTKITVLVMQHWVLLIPMSRRSVHYTGKICINFYSSSFNSNGLKSSWWYIVIILGD